MIRFILSLSIVFIAFQSLADFSNEIIGFQQKQLSLIKGWNIEGAIVLVEEDNSFCILSRSGGGDSGGGIVRNLQMPKAPPQDDGGKKKHEPWEQRFERFLDKEFVDVNMPMVPDGMLYTDTTFDVLELLSCQNGQGIPFEVRSNVKFLLSEMRSHALEQGRVDDVRFLSKVINLLS